MMSKSVASLTKKVNATEINESSKETTSKANTDDNYLRELFLNQNDYKNTSNGFKSRRSFRGSGQKGPNPARHKWHRANAAG